MAALLFLPIFFPLIQSVNYDCSSQNCNQVFVFDEPTLNTNFYCKSSAECSNLVIYYAGSSSLNVYCSTQYGCNGTQIYCGDWPPITSITNSIDCSVHCDSATAPGCLNVLFSCKSVPGQIDSCWMGSENDARNIQDSTIECNIATGLDENCELSCFGTGCLRVDLLCHSNAHCYCTEGNCGSGTTIYNGITYSPTDNPTKTPITQIPTSQPTPQPTSQPTSQPTLQPSNNPTNNPTSQPTTQPTPQPTTHPTTQPTIQPTVQPTVQPTTQPTANPSDPTKTPSQNPTSNPSVIPTVNPTPNPTGNPSEPTGTPSQNPTDNPSHSPSDIPTELPTYNPTKTPSDVPTSPTGQPTYNPTHTPTFYPSQLPSTDHPTLGFPAKQPSVSPSITQPQSTVESGEITTETKGSSGADTANDDGLLGGLSIWVVVGACIGLIVINICCLCLFKLCRDIRQQRKAMIAEQEDDVIEGPANINTTTTNTNKLERVSSMSSNGVQMTVPQNQFPPAFPVTAGGVDGFNAYDTNVNDNNVDDDNEDDELDAMYDDDDDDDNDLLYTAGTTKTTAGVVDI